MGENEGVMCGCTSGAMESCQQYEQDTFHFAVSQNNRGTSFAQSISRIYAALTETLMPPGNHIWVSPTLDHLIGNSPELLKLAGGATDWQGSFLAQVLRKSKILLPAELNAI